MWKVGSVFPQCLLAACFDSVSSESEAEFGESLGLCCEVWRDRRVRRLADFLCVGLLLRRGVPASRCMAWGLV